MRRCCAPADNRHCELAKEGRCRGLDQGFSGVRNVVPLERKKDGSFSARSSVWKRRISGGIGICGAENRQAGRQILDGKILVGYFKNNIIIEIPCLLVLLKCHGQ